MDTEVTWPPVMLSRGCVEPAVVPAAAVSTSHASDHATTPVFHGNSGLVCLTLRPMLG